MYNGTSIKTFIIFYWYGIINGWNNDFTTCTRTYGFRCVNFFQWVCDIVFKYFKNGAKLLTATLCAMAQGSGFWYHAPINKKEKYERRYKRQSNQSTN